MTYLSKIFIIVIVVTLVFTGCQSTDYGDNIDIGAEYPIEMFPIYKDAIVYKYQFVKGVIDITFGTEDDFEKVASYYDLLFEHSKYDVTAKKTTTQGYISAGKTNLYKFLLEVDKAVYRKEKKLYSTVVNLRITINNFVLDSSFEATPTPALVDKITPPPTDTIAPTDTPIPSATPYTFSDMEVISTVNMLEDKIFIECLDVVETINDTSKTISLLLKIINYSDDETGYISSLDFTLIDDEGNAYYSDIMDGVFASGVNILPGGYCVDTVSFVVDKDVIASVLAMPDGLGNRISSSYDLEVAPLAPPIDAGAYDEYIADVADISAIPTFIIGQEYTLDNELTIKLSDAKYFNNHTTVNQENLMYTFNIEFTNISSNVIIPAEMRDFVLYDIKHNIYIKPTIDLTPFDELLFNPVQNGLSKNYNISFEIFEEIEENYLCLLLYSKNQQNNLIIYKIR